MSKPLNFLFLQGEDVGRHLGCYGDEQASTPNLDRLAAQGVRYTHAFTHSPVCAPSRGGMVTGQYPYSLGNHHMRSTLASPPRPFVQELKEAGYVVNWNTKMDFNFDPEEGWRNDASDWYKQPAPEEPFFFYENMDLTHESRMFPEGREAFEDLPPEAEGVPFHNPDDLMVPPTLTDCPESRQQLANYYDAFSIIDAQIGRRLQWLEDQGCADSTVVIFLSDHGRGFPREKRWCYDAGLHLPLIIRWPGQVEPGTVSHDLVGWVDIAPTVLSLAGVPIPESYQGQVFLGDQAAEPREAVFAGRDRMDEIYDRVRVCREHKWHYIHNFAPKLPWAQYQQYMEQQPIMGVMRGQQADGELSGSQAAFFLPEKPVEELYDCEADPYCLHNLVGNTEVEEVLHRLRVRLQEHLREVDDLGTVTEEELIEQGILTDRLSEYRERRDQAPTEDMLGPLPFPMTLREARKIGRGDSMHP